MPVSVGSIDSFVSEAASAFTTAYDTAAPDERGSWYLHLADRLVHVRIAGSDLAERLTPALLHRAGPASLPIDLTIGCWDRRATNVAPPPPPCTIDDFLAGGRIRGNASDRVRVTYDTWMRTLCIYDRDARVAYVHTADAALVPDWVRRAPLRSILTWWASDRGLAFLHASGVTDGAGAVVLAGASGAGKSTTAMACLAAGLGFLGDDACIVRLDPDPVAYAVYAFAKLEPDALARLPRLRREVVDPSAEQLVVKPRTQLAARAPLRAVLLLRVTGERRTRVVATSMREARQSLVDSTVLEGDGVGRQALRAVTQLVQRVPCARLELGTDVRGVVDAVRSVLERR